MNKENEMTQEEIDKVYAEMNEYDNEVDRHNKSILEEYEISDEDFKDLTMDCRLNGKIQIVDKPKGSNQNETYDGAFYQVFVDQWSTGMEGDSYAGFIYAEVHPNKWLMIPYDC